MVPQHNTSAKGNGSGKLSLCDLGVLQLREGLIPLCSPRSAHFRGCAVRETLCEPDRLLRKELETMCGEEHGQA